MKNIKEKVIEAISKHNGEFTSWQITMEIEKVYKKHWWDTLGFGVVITILNDLEKQGVVTSRWEMRLPDELHTKPRRRLYKVAKL